MSNPSFPFDENYSDDNFPLYKLVDDRSANFNGFFSSDNFGGGLDGLWSGNNFQPESPNVDVASFPASNDLQSLSEFTAFDDAHFNAVSTVIESLQIPAVTATEDPERSSVPATSLHRSKEKSRQLDTEGTDDKQATIGATVETGNALSTEEVVRIAAANFIQLSALVSGDPRKLGLPFGLSYSNLTSDEIKNVDLVCLLMTAADKLSKQQFDRAEDLVRRCHVTSSRTGNPVQRVVHCFADALQERIDRETGKIPSKGSKGAEITTGEDVMKAILTNHSVHLIVNSTLPFTQVSQFTAVQAVLDSMSTAKKIHLIDLSIKHGLQWAILMQALATRETCPIDSLKITAVGALDEVVTIIGKRLSSFAESLNLPFEFRTVIVADLKDLTVDMFDLEGGEELGIWSDLVMNSMLVNPEGLEKLMSVICKLNPRVMAVLDVEAGLNSRSFINRFTEALFYFSAFFDCLDDLMEPSDRSRMMIEGDFFSQGIKCILAAEGSQRVIRQVGIRVWRSFFARFGLIETELSESSLYQARLILKKFVKDDSCTVQRNGNALLTLWKGTPLHFVSAWKFRH
ncbi:uncharacterized protein A4U43_C07F10840 [Asparagus officinalis]|uniref:Uncharacterized protein n=1 Tax=Asparagus officinalis TaxID=4686 RepID=A0A5P1EAY3_ASPOF|nr:scarecrow-like protein 18 [Asparagus officinalis]ONK63045.1 uncharacterized protein A4U43_C07F10840 [Asparagus officinalis]